MNSHEIIELKFPADLKYATTARLALSGIAQRMNFTVDEIEDMKLCLGEAFNNAVSHGYDECNQKGSVQLTFLVYPDKIIIKVRDYGKGCDNNILLEHQKKSKGKGLGLFLMKTLTDRLECHSQPQKGCEIIMEKRLSTR